MRGVSKFTPVYDAVDVKVDEGGGARDYGAELLKRLALEPESETLVTELDGMEAQYCDVDKGVICALDELHGSF